MRRRVILSMAVGASLMLGLIASPAAQAGTAAKSNSGRVVHKAARTAARPASISSFKKFKQPVAKYVGKTCVIDLSAIPDFTAVSSVTGCGETISFSVTLEKRSVPNSWATWGAPPDTETDTPNILYTAGNTSVTLTYSDTNRRVGMEAEPDLFQVETTQAVFKNKGGKTIGTVTRDPNGQNGALLFAGATDALQKHWIKTVEISNLAGDDFAIAQLRVS